MANSYKLSYNNWDRQGWEYYHTDPGSFIHDDWDDQGTQNSRINNPSYGPWYHSYIYDVRVTWSTEGTRAYFKDNTVNYSNGAAIRYSWSTSTETEPRLFVHNTDFANNNCSNRSGIVYVKYATQVEFNNCTFKTNHVFSGGALTVYSTDATSITSCVFNGNTSGAENHHGAIYCDSTSLTITNCQFQTITDGIYVTKTDATFKGHNYMAGNIIGENTIWVDTDGASHSIDSIKIENDTTSPETIANSKLEFAGKIISADISGGTGSTIQFKNSGTYTYATAVPGEYTTGAAYSHEVQVNGTFTGVENLVFSGDKPIRFDGGSINESNQLVGNVKTAKTLTIDAGKLGTTGWDPYTVATGIVFDPIAFDFGTGTYEPTNVGEFLKLDIVVDGTTVAKGGQPGQSVLLSVVDDGDANGPDYTYRFDHTGFDHTGEDRVTRTYGLLYHDTVLILTELKTQDLFVNSWYEIIYRNGINELNKKNIYGEKLFPNVDMIGVHEFAYLTIDGHTFTPNEDDDFGETRYKSINKAYDNLVGTNVYVTGGTFSGDQYGYGANLVVCNDQRNGFEMIMEGNAVSAVHSNPMRKVDLETVKSAGAETNGKSMFTDGVNGYYLFGGANLTVASTDQAFGTVTRSVNIYAGLEGKGVFTGDRIMVNATGGSMTLQNTKLVVKESKAGYESSTVATSPDCQVSYLMGGSYISGGSTEGEAYAMTLNQGTTVTIDKTAADLAVSLYACAGSLVGGGYDGKQLEVKLKGHPSLSISSGTYEYLVAGGNLLQGDATSLHHIGNTSLTIDGGTFKGNIYGGNISRRLQEATSERLTMTGNTNILIKLDGQNEVNISEPTGTTPGYYGNIFGGSNGKGKVVGNTNIVFQGDEKEANDGSRLTFTGAISGDSSGAGYFHQDGVFGHYGFVTGDRNLTFQDFDGDFNTSKIVNIDTITFTGNTYMKFTNPDLNLTDIGTWKFNYYDAGLTTLDCSAMTNVLDVSDDKLVVGGDLSSWDGSSIWTLLDAKGLEGNFSSVTLFGAGATKEGDNKWTATVDGSNLTLTLELDRANGTLALSKV